MPAGRGEGALEGSLYHLLCVSEIKWSVKESWKMTLTIRSKHFILPLLVLNVEI